MTRGLRNNNPGNLRRSADRWQGLASVQSDPDFFTFKEMKWGYRALLRTLQNYQIRHACMTVRDFISRYAPPSENNTEGYIKTVLQRTGWAADHIVDIYNEDEMAALAAAISYVENGTPAVEQDIRNGWALL